MAPPFPGPRGPRARPAAPQPEPGCSAAGLQRCPALFRADLLSESGPRQPAGPSPHLMSPPPSARARNGRACTLAHYAPVHPATTHPLHVAPTHPREQPLHGTIRVFAAAQPRPPSPLVSVIIEWLLQRASNPKRGGTDGETEGHTHTHTHRQTIRQINIRTPKTAKRQIPPDELT